MAQIDVIIVNWNDLERTPMAIDSVLATQEVLADPSLVDIFISDNGSADGSVASLRERYGSRLTVIENGANLGFAAGVNRALWQSSSPFVFLLNPDARVESGCLQTLLEFMRANPKCAIAGPTIIEDDGSIAESCGEFDTWAQAFLRSSAWGELAPLRRFANGAQLRAWDYKSRRRVDLVIGAALMLRRSVFEEVGGFDERFFMYHEEVDLAKRVAQAGYESWFVPQARAHHSGQGSSGGANVERYKQASRRKYWIKHHGHAWYYSLSAALVGRYFLYAGVLTGLALVARRALGR